MNITCNYEGSTVNIIGIKPSMFTGHLEISYVDSNQDLKRVTVEQTELIATNVTSIDGRLTT